jgi:hypothetical protein
LKLSALSRQLSAKVNIVSRTYPPPHIIHTQMETLRAEIRASIAEASAEFYRRVNGL